MNWAGFLWSAVVLFSTASAADTISQSSIQYTDHKGKTRNVRIYAPTSAGRYPLFVWLTGTNGIYTGPAEERITRSMASRGMVAISVDYANTFADGFFCDVLWKKAESIFGPQVTSAVEATRSSVASTDVSKGIVVAGFSEGAWIAHLGAGIHPEIRAAWYLSTGLEFNSYGISFPLPCNSYIAVPVPARAVSGQNDRVYSGGATTTSPQKVGTLMTQLSVVTGIPANRESASTYQSAITESGAGWILVRNSQVESGSAEHGYFYLDNNFLNQSQSALDPQWDSTTEPWGRLFNESWLFSKVAR